MQTHRGKLPKPDPRKIAAQIAADKRWGKEIERATHQGIINIADTSLDCYVLTDGRRIISQTSIMSILGRSQSSGRRTRNDNRPPFLEANNLLPYITPELKVQLQRVQYRVGDEKQEKVDTTPKSSPASATYTWTQKKMKFLPKTRNQQLLHHDES